MLGCRYRNTVLLDLINAKKSSYTQQEVKKYEDYYQMQREMKDNQQN